MWRGEGEPPMPPPWSPTPHRVEIVEPSRPYQVMVFEPGRPSTGRIALVVASGLYPAVSNAVAGYAADLRAQGFSTVTLTFGGSAEQLRGTLSNLHASAESLKGAVLVGDLPYALWEMRKVFSGVTNYYAEIADIFFMDLNGQWYDTNSTPPFATGRYDGRAGNLELEIWVSRVRPGGLSAFGPGWSSEVALTTNFFWRLHRYRATNLVMSKSGVTYTDRDWNSHRDSDRIEMEAGYPAAVTSRAVGVDAGAGGPEFRDVYLGSDCEMLQIRAHGTSASLLFDDGTVLTYADWTNRDPRAVFCHIYGCGTGDFTATNNLARLAVFNPEANGLVSWSHSGVGGMISLGLWYRTSVFFDALGEGETVGEAFRRWYNACVAADTKVMPGYEATPTWWNGMILNGDGALTVRTPRHLYVSPSGSHSPPYGSWAAAATNLHAAVALAGRGDIVFLAAGVYQLTSALNLASSKEITLRGTATNQGVVIRAAPGTNIAQIGRNVRAVIENVTLTGGRAVYGGAVYMQGGILRDCWVVGNTGQWAAGGVYVGGPLCRVERCRIESNVTPGTAGGVLVMDDGPVIEGCRIAYNRAETAGGVSLTESGALVRCTIANNTASGTLGGGGIYVVGDGAPVWHCIVTGNLSHSRGGGLTMFRGRLLNSLVAANTASGYAGGVFAQGYTNTPALQVFIENCTVADNRAPGAGCGLYATQHTFVVNTIAYGNGADDWHDAGGPNVAARYSCFGETVPGVGNLAADPRFVGGGDWRLQPGSPCINAGTALVWHADQTDLDGAARVLGGAVDMGAWEAVGGGEPDSDGDGMPDAWETRFGLDPHSPADAAADPDEDGANNLAEYFADTVPTNAQSVFRISAIALGGGVNVGFVSATSRLYSLETRLSLATGAWSAVAGRTNVPGGAGAMWLDDPAATGRFYRVRVRPP